MKTSEVLNKAADLIQERGWGTGSWEPSGDGPLCIEGAVAAAMGIDDESEASTLRCPATEAVRVYLGRVPFLWNDKLKHERTGELIREGLGYEDAAARALIDGRAKVIEVLRAAAVIEAAKEGASIEVAS